MVSDSTVEALAPILNENPRGSLLTRDELSGLIAGLDKYNKGGSSSSDVQRYLEIYNCESITVDRRTGVPPFIFVRRPQLSITGGIQPGTLARCLTTEHKDNGLQSRLLPAYPPRQPKCWRDEEVSEQTVKLYHKLVSALFQLCPNTEEPGFMVPSHLRLTRPARDCFKAFVNSHGAEQNGMHGHLAAQWSKLEEIPVRLAIVLHCVRQVTTGVEHHFDIDDRTMSAAIAMTEWFKSECLRINRLLAEPEETRKARHLMEWLQTRGGSITARDLCKYRRDIESADDAEKMLTYLVSLGAGKWEGTHKSRKFFLSVPVSAFPDSFPEETGQSPTKGGPGN